MILTEILRIFCRTNISYLISSDVLYILIGNLHDPGEGLWMVRDKRLCREKNVDI